MPTLKVELDRFLTPLKMTEEEFENLLFDFGLELDETIKENEVKYCKIDIPANRYDLLTHSNLLLSLNVFLERDSFKDLEIQPSRENEYISFENLKDKKNERGYVVSAIIEGLNLKDKKIYDDFIAYQDILHQNLGRDRKFMSMGTHDFDKIKFPVFYKKVGNQKFIPLKENSEVEIKNLRENYESKNDKKMAKYCDYMHENPFVFVDSNNEILSVPPVINSEYSKLTEDTQNVFIEITGTDELKVNAALKFMLYAFRGNKIRAVKVNSETFKMNNYEYSLNLEEIKKELGIDISIELCKKNLEKMLHKVEIKNKLLKITVPDIRDDILHKVDLLEDIAIPYGFNNFENKLPDFFFQGKELTLNKISDLIRSEIASCNFSEALNLNLLSEKEHNLFCNAEVKTLNPSSLDCQVLRKTLLPGLLKCVVSNKHLPLPIKIFEVGDITEKVENDVNFINKRHVGGIIANQNDAFEEIQGLCSHLLDKLNIKNYAYREIENKQYLKNRGGEILVNKKSIGTFGIISPEILNFYKMNVICSVFEFNLSELIK